MLILKILGIILMALFISIWVYLIWFSISSSIEMHKCFKNSSKKEQKKFIDNLRKMRVKYGV